MNIDEKIAAHFPDTFRQRGETILADALEAFARGGADDATRVLLTQAVALEENFDRQLEELEKLL